MTKKINKFDKFNIFLGILILALIYYSFRTKIKENFSNLRDLEYLIMGYLKIYDCFTKKHKLYLLKRIATVIVPDFIHFMLDPIYIFYEKINDTDLEAQFEKIGYQEIKPLYDKSHQRYIKQFIPLGDNMSDILKPKQDYELYNYIETMNFLSKKVILKIDLYDQKDIETFDACWKNILLVCPCIIVSINLEHVFEKTLKNINKHFYLMHIQLDNCEKINIIKISDNNRIKGSLSKKIKLTFIHKKYVTKAVQKKIVHLPTEIDTPMCIGENLELTIKYGNF